MYACLKHVCMFVNVFFVCTRVSVCVHLVQTKAKLLKAKLANAWK